MTVYNVFEVVAAAAAVLTLIRFFIKKPENFLVSFLQDFIGCFFIFSGFVKAVDPLGTSYKMHEYFEAFANEGFRHFWEMLAHYSTPMAITMIAAELFIGFMLIIGWKPRFTIAIIWWLTLFFTLLTGYTYLSGFCISKLFLLLCGIVIFLFAIIAIPKNQTMRYRLTFLAFAALVALYLFCKFSHRCFLCGFAETGMKVTDCGCFGDFIKLKPWETFYKDIILDGLILILVLAANYIKPVFGAMLNNGLAGVSAIVATVFCLYNTYWSEPVIDFRPYKIGSDIKEAMRVIKPEKREMQWQYHNKTTGQWETITYDQVMKSQVQYDKYDTNYREDKILDPGIPAKITNLSIENDEGMMITDTIFANPDYSLMVVSPDLNISNEPAFKQLNAIAAACDKMGIKFFAVVKRDDKVEEFRHRNQTAYPFYGADDTPLKTMIRSNPGLILLKNGVVINKWHFRHLPTFEQLNQQYFKK